MEELKQTISDLDPSVKIGGATVVTYAVTKDASAATTVVVAGGTYYYIWLPVIKPMISLADDIYDKISGWVDFSKSTDERILDNIIGSAGEFDPSAIITPGFFYSQMIQDGINAAGRALGV